MCVCGCENMRCIDVCGCGVGLYRVERVCVYSVHPCEEHMCWSECVFLRHVRLDVRVYRRVQVRAGAS